MRVLWSKPALRDLEAIGEFTTANNSAAVAGRIIGRIFASIDNLSRFPRAGRTGRVPGTRELVIAGAPFIAPYPAHDDRVETLAVFHEAGRWPTRFD